MSYIRTDELENAKDNLEAITYFLKFLPEEKRLKWVIIALHQALYGYAISATMGTTSSKTLIKKGGSLISIQEALKRCQDSKYMKMMHESKEISISSKQMISIKRLISEFRNNFKHFSPKLWSVQKEILKPMFLDVLDVIELIAKTKAMTYYEEKHELRTFNAIDEIRKEINDKY